MSRRHLVAMLVLGGLLVPLGVSASHQFNDVPDSHTFHNALDWMKDNNITVGCNPPAITRFCPDDNVTRGQMAAFMKRLAESGTVDAGTLRGQGASAYQSPIWGSSLDFMEDGTAPVTGNVNAGPELHTLDVAPTADGIFAVTYSVGLGGDFGFWAWVWLQYDESDCDMEANRTPGSSYAARSEAGMNDGIRQVGVTLAVPTTAGNHTLLLWERWRAVGRSAVTAPASSPSPPQWAVPSSCAPRGGCP